MALGMTIEESVAADVTQHVDIDCADNEVCDGAALDVECENGEQAGHFPRMAVEDFAVWCRP
jgi:hypothetical protein